MSYYLPVLKNVKCPGWMFQPGFIPFLRMALHGGKRKMDVKILAVICLKSTTKRKMMPSRTGLVRTSMFGCSNVAGCWVVCGNPDTTSIILYFHKQNCPNMKLKCRPSITETLIHVAILTKFSPLVAPQVVKMTTSGATSDENFIKIAFMF